MSGRATNSGKKLCSSNFSRQLGLYSLTAVAAGVSMLALAQPAEGGVVVTTKTIRIPLSYWGTEGVGISFQNDGMADLKLVLSDFAVFGTAGACLKAVNAAEGKGVTGQIYAYALPPGAPIGPDAHFMSAACEGSHSCYSAARLARTFVGSVTRTVFGPWAGNPKTAYLGVRFFIDGERHYGWVRLTVNTSIQVGMTATITAYAYETEPNAPISAGAGEEPTAELQPQANIQNQPGPSLGMLALGADAVPLWRRDEALASK